MPEINTMPAAAVVGDLLVPAPRDGRGDGIGPAAPASDQSVPNQAAPAEEGNASEGQVVSDSSTRPSRPASFGGAQRGAQRFRQTQTQTISLKDVARGAALAAEREAMAKILEQTRWNRVRAAKLLNISYRALLYKIKKAGLAPMVRSRL